MTANLIHNNQINIKRGNGIKCHKIPKVLSKMCNHGDSKNNNVNKPTPVQLKFQNCTTVSNTKPLVNNLVTKTNICAAMRKTANTSNNINTVHCLAYSSFM